jgi:hypothetical protein
MDFKQTLTILEANVSVKKLHFTFKDKIPSEMSVWKWIEKQEYLTVEDFTFPNLSSITINLHFPSNAHGNQKQDLKDFTEGFCDRFSASPGKSNE